MRLSQRLRKRTGRIALPGERARFARLALLGTKLAQARASREISTDDAKVASRDAIEETVPDGWAVRRGGPDEPKRAEPLPEWKKPPPENP